MTHEELLNSIKHRLDFIEKSEYADDIVLKVIISNHIKELNALRAVVELHHPNEFNDCCNGCDSDLPCPTIQAIEKELNK